MSTPDSALQQRFQQAADQVNNLPADQNEAMTTLYGLYKQATVGDHDENHEVNPTEHDNPDGPAGLSQAQWDSWSQLKGTPREDAMRRYISEAGKITGKSDASSAAGESEGVPADRLPGTVSADTDLGDAKGSNTDQPASTGGGGLRGDLEAGLTYGSEEELKEEQ